MIASPAAGRYRHPEGRARHQPRTGVGREALREAHGPQQARGAREHGGPVSDLQLDLTLELPRLPGVVQLQLQRHLARQRLLLPLLHPLRTHADSKRLGVARESGRRGMPGAPGSKHGARRCARRHCWHGRLAQRSSRTASHAPAAAQTPSSPAPSHHPESAGLCPTPAAAAGTLPRIGRQPQYSGLQPQAKQARASCSQPLSSHSPPQPTGSWPLARSPSQKTRHTVD